MCYFSARYLRLSVHVPVSAFVLDPILSHLLRDITSASLLPHHFFSLLDYFHQLLFLPSLKKKKQRKKDPLFTTYFPPLFFVCLCFGFFVGFFVSFCSIIPRKSCLHCYCQIFSSHALLNPLPIRPLSAPFSHTKSSSYSGLQSST